MPNFYLKCDEKRIPTLEKNGNTYVLGVYEKAYTIVVEVNEYVTGRVLCVSTVDGLDVLSSKPGDYHDNRGYVFQNRLEIAGWRISDEKCAAFRFGSVEGSYAELSEKRVRVL